MLCAPNISSALLARPVTHDFEYSHKDGDSAYLKLLLIHLPLNHSLVALWNFITKQQWFQEMLMGHFTMNRIWHWTPFWSIFHIVASVFVRILYQLKWKLTSEGVNGSCSFYMPLHWDWKWYMSSTKAILRLCCFYPRPNQLQCLIKFSTLSHPTCLACLIRIWESDLIQVFSVT